MDGMRGLLILISPFFLLTACDKPPEKDRPSAELKTQEHCIPLLADARSRDLAEWDTGKIQQLERCGEAGLGLLSLALDAKDAGLRRVAIEALGRGRVYGARMLVGALVKDPSGAADLRQPAWSAVQALSGARDADARQQAAILLERMVEADPSDPRGLEALGGLMADADAAVRRVALRSLDMLGERAKPQLQAVSHCLLMDAEDSLRAAAAETLGQMGPVGQAELERLLGHADSDVRRHVLVALGRLNLTPEKLRQVLSARLADPDPALRRAAYDSILPLAMRGEERGLLLQGLHDESTSVRLHILGLLAQLPAREDSIKALRMRLREGSAEEVRLAAERLGALGPQAKSVLADLATRAEGSKGEKAIEQGAARACLRALVLIQADKHKLARELGHLFEKAQSLAVRVLAAEKLGAMGRDAGGEEKRLKRGMTDEDAQIRAAALGAMLGIRRAARAGST